MSKKAVVYHTKDNGISMLAKAMGHPARVAILKHLCSVDSCFFGEIKLPLSNATISQHLSELKASGLVDFRVETPKVRYMINRKNWEAAKANFNIFFEDISETAGTPPPLAKEPTSQQSGINTSGWVF